MDYSEHINFLRQAREKLSVKRQELTAEIDMAIKNYDDLIGYYEKNTSSSVSLPITNSFAEVVKKATWTDNLSIQVISFPMDEKLEKQIIWILKNKSRAIKKSEMDLIFSGQFGRQIEIRHTLRKLKDRGEIATLSFGGSRRYVYFALPEWIVQREGKYKVYYDFTPIDDFEERINPELLIVDYRHKKSKTPEITGV